MRYDDRKAKNWRSTDTGETTGQLGWNTEDNLDYWQLDIMANIQGTFVSSTALTLGISYCF
ncbi:MAG: hypothetical protein K9N10_15060 [Deltaproteobacteria bacterium]|nr:hypothetical protein [Deltaproteobacteria bacterium]